MLNKISKHLVQQIVQQKELQKKQQKMRNNYVALLIKLLVFTKLVECLY